MNRGEFLTKLSVWLALTAYTIGTGWWLAGRGRRDWEAGARWAWTLGCAFFLAHVTCAFSYFHQWSHAAAYRETARQTAELTGWHWGGGIYINYFFAAAWLGDVLWSWMAPESFAHRSPRLNALWHGFFFFMIVNGAVIFVHGPMRWLGAILCLSLAIMWVHSWRTAKAPIADRQS